MMAPDQAQHHQTGQDAAREKLHGATFVAQVVGPDLPINRCSRELYPRPDRTTFVELPSAAEFTRTDREISR
jgi:hypothetical protein